MFQIRIDDEAIVALMRKFPKQANRAAEVALDKTVEAISDAVQAELPRVFDRPTRYTLNSLKVTKTQGHNMRASVWFKTPDRMGQHYLVPQVEGGDRRRKGFERALGNYYVPARSSMDQSGNMPYGRIVQLLSVLAKAEYISGYSANVTEESKRRNRKSRDYVLLRNRHGRLPPGVYQRYQTSAGFGARTKRTLPFGEWQKGRTKGRFSSVIRARGLRPVLFEARDVSYRPRLPFYQIGNEVAEARFKQTFLEEMARGLEPRVSS